MLERTETGDGSHSLLHTVLQEHYHSQHGALQESQHVFLNMGLTCIQSPEIHVLEFGFGTGLNTLLTQDFAEKTKQVIHYHGLEKYPIKSDIWRDLNYGTLLGRSKEFENIHQASWEQWSKLSDNFYLHKNQIGFEDFQPKENHYDIIYFDAFAPRYHPEAWQEVNLKVCYRALKPGGIWVTYCAQGAVRRQLIEVGFQVERLQGPPGKREMLRATKPK
ncbi:MAG: SAM-dependent methyltransferase [Flavobacteriales bacterium]|nr:MAG: SAM-dependent methyltransferase [Flavobacteriales bacterium]